MIIRTVQIVSGTETPVGEGINQPIKALVRLGDDQILSAIIKVLDPRGFSAEIFCSILCRAWGLDVPEIAIVKDKNFTVASIDVGYPNLKQKIGWSDSLPPSVQAILERQGALLVSSFSSTPKALAIDEAINNRDRNFGNILWDGSNVSWIDHERALGCSSMDDLNKLVMMSILSGKDLAVQQAAVAISMTLTADVVTDVANELINDGHTTDFQTFILERLPKLTAMIIDRFPPPQDLLTNIQ